ncbi:MAG: DUF1570 domain-containing protein [Kiritimatiellia bacterium]
MKTALFVLVAVACAAAGAAPMLKTQAELVADGELKAKVLAGSQGIPAPTPQAKQYEVKSGSTGETRQVKLYAVADIWRLRAFAGEWKDKKGNVMRLARVTSLIPAVIPSGLPAGMPAGEADREAIDKALDAAEKTFTGSEEELAAWKAAWGGFAVGRFIALKGRRYYVEFAFAETVKPADREKLLKAFEKSVSTMTAGAGGAIASMKWWEVESPQYRFMTDLDKAKGGKFVKDAMKLMDAMRKSYEFYVPPQKTLDKCTVRVFRTLAGHRDYRKSTGDDDQMSCGLWDPNREELLIAAEDRDFAQNTMRHEAFHQYLHYATGNGNHALWFNEGHACFFENVRYNPAKNTVKVVDEGNRAMWVSKNPERYARQIMPILKMSHAEFYSGDANTHYCTAWALIYFLEKGVYTSDEFAAYRTILPKYLELTANGVDARTATAQAWAAVATRDVAADFLKFWKEKRKAAVNAR